MKSPSSKNPRPANRNGGSKKQRRDDTSTAGSGKTEVEKKSFDLHLLKCRLPEYLHAIGCELRFSNDDHFTTACPVHGGVKQNFHADRQPDGTWLWVCRSGCGGDGGSVLDLHARLHHLDAKSHRCIAGAAEVLHVDPDERYQPPRVSIAERDKRERERLQRAKAEREAKAIANHLQRTLEKRLEPFAHNHHFDCWRDALDAGSLIDLKDHRHDSRLFIESLFHPDDRIWIGEVGQSGKDHHQANFRPCAEWFEQDRLPPRIGAGIFKPGSFSRCQDNVLESPYIIIESDNLIGHQPRNPEEAEQNKAMSFSLFFYSQEKLGLHPRGVIDTGNKSLHLWFDRPPPDELSAIIQLADGLRIDRGLLEKCQAAPLRLPGTIHEKTSQKAELLFLNPITIPAK